MSAPAEWHDSEEWLTIAEVARRIGISERQARRDAASLPESDRTPPDVRPVRLRWSAIAVTRSPAESPANVSIVRQDSDTSAQPVHSSDTSGLDQAPAGAVLPPIGAESVSGGTSDVSGANPDGESAHIADLRAEIVHLRAQLAEKDKQIERAQIMAEHEQKLRLVASGRDRPALIEPPKPRENWLSSLWGIFVQRD